MAKVGTQVEMDADVLSRVDSAARQLGRSRDQLIEDSVRRALAQRYVSKLFARVQARTDLTEGEAEAIAYTELRDYRNNRQTRAGDVPPDALTELP